MIDRSILPSWRGGLAGPARVVGLTFDDHEFRAVEVRRRHGGGQEIVRTGTIPLDPGVVDHGEIVDRETFSTTLRRLWAESGFGTKNIAVGLDGRTTIVRPAKLPTLDADDMASAAAYEIAELLSYPLDEAVVSTVEVGREQVDGTERVRTVTLATRQIGLLQLHDAIGQAGLHQVATQLISSSLVSVIAGPGKGPGTEGSVNCMVHVSSTVTLVLMYDDGGLTFSRAITAGVDVGETTLSDELEMELARLAGYRGGPDGPSVAETERSDPGMATVVEAVRRTMEYYATEVDERPIQQVMLCGPQSSVVGLDAAIGGPIPHITVLRHQFGGFPGTTEEVSAYDAAASVAIAAGRPDGGRRFDLEPQVLRQRRTDRRRTVVGLAAAAVLTPVLVADAAGRRTSVADEAVAADAMEVSVEAVRNELASFDHTSALLIDAKQATDRVNALLEQELAFPTAVRRIAESMPEDTFLISFRIGRTTGGQPPIGYTGDPPAATFSLTGVAGDHDGAGRWIQDVDEISVVDGIWLTQSTIGPYGATDVNAAVFTVNGVLTGPADPTFRLPALDEAEPAGLAYDGSWRQGAEPATDEDGPR